MKKSTLLNLLISLAVIAVFAAPLIGFIIVNENTKEVQAYNERMAMIDYSANLQDKIYFANLQNIANDNQKRVNDLYK